MRTRSATKKEQERVRSASKQAQQERVRSASKQAHQVAVVKEPSTLPLDVWGAISRELYAAPNASVADLVALTKVSSLLYVSLVLPHYFCARLTCTQQAANRYVYRTVTIYDRDELSALARALTEPDTLVHFSRLTKEIVILTSKFVTLSVEDLHLLLSNAPFLVRFHTGGTPLSVSTFSVLATSCRGLETLEVGLRRDVNQSFCKIARMTELRSLTVHMERDWTLEPEAHFPSTWAWQSGAVRTLQLHLTDPCHQSAQSLFRVLGDAALPALHEFTLSVARYSPAAPDAARLRAFLHRHDGVHITGLMTQRPGADEHFRQILASVRSPHLRINVPLLKLLIEHPLPHIRTLTLDVDDARAAQVNRLFSRVIASATPPGRLLRSIQIVVPQDPDDAALPDEDEFVWTASPRTDARETFVGKLLHQALAFQQLGVTVFDQHGVRLAVMPGAHLAAMP
jgi:hypothetical protein